MKYFTIRKQFLFPSFTIDAEEQKKLDRYLQFLDDSNVGRILFFTKQRNLYGGRPSYNRYDMFATMLYGFAFGSGTLRDLETYCKYDLRYIYLMQYETPSYVAFCDFFNTYIVPNSEKIFAAISSAVIKTCNIELNDAFIDGTKIEANANKYKFVWKPTTFHIRLCDKIRNLLVMNDLGRGIPNTDIFSSKIIASKVTEFSELSKKCDPAQKKALEKQYSQLVSYLEKAIEYEEKEAICGDNRNSYYKTDHDATAMTLKTDYYSGLGSNMHAAYNVQSVVVSGIVCAYYVSQSRADINDFIPTIEMFYRCQGCYPKNICADSGYGSLKNYSYLHEKNIGNYVKHQSWEGNVTGKNPDRYRLEENGTITCLAGNTGVEVQLRNRHPKNSQSVFFKIEGCYSCPFNVYCKRWQKIKDEDYKIFEVNKELCTYKQEAEENLLSPKGIEIRVNRSAQVEGSFGNLKQNMHYSRFRRRSLKKVSAEFMFTFLGYDIRKLFRYFEGKLKISYWKAPDNLTAEKFKKPSAKRLANKVRKKQAKNKNQEAKKYKYKKTAKASD